MKLTYRGQDYTVANQPIDAVPTGETATFLGRRYPRKQFAVAQRQQPGEALTYRGIRYTR